MKIFITGATSGIGLELAKLYLNEGHTVGVCGRNISKVPKDITDNYPMLKLFECSVTDREKLIEVVDLFAMGTLDIMIANAGISDGRKLSIPDFEVARNIIDINTMGTLNAFEAAFNIMKKNKNGHLVATGSVAGFVGLPGAAAYSASKAAIFKICESFSIDLKQLNISTTLIAPGFIDTPLTRKNSHKMPFIISSQKGALKIKKAIEAKKKLYIFPWPMKFVITFLDKMPRFCYRFIMSVPPFNYNKR